MDVLRIVGALGILATLTASTGAQLDRRQTLVLAEPIQKGDCFQIQLHMQLSGKLHLHQGDGTTSLPLKAEAKHTFIERALDLARDSTIARSARVYETAELHLTVNHNASKHALRPDRRLLVAGRYKDQSLVYSPRGPLTREELDLTAKQFDTLTLPGLLPGRDLQDGGSWKVASNVVQALCGLDGVTEHSLKGKLKTVNDQQAVFVVSGKVTGIELGALVKVTVQAAGTFDCKAQRLTYLRWQQKDEREQGPASPASTVETTTVVQRQGIDQPGSLSPDALASVPAGVAPPEAMLYLDYRDPQGRYHLLHERDWNITGKTDDHLVLRLLDRGSFLAQATITPWTQAEKGKHLSGDAFRSQMNRTYGWQPEQQLQAGEVPVQDDRWIYRLSTLGTLEGIKVVQNFYVIANPDGQQVVVVFTLTPQQVDKFGSRDLALIANLDVLTPGKN
jgi:hypothetical protein